MFSCLANQSIITQLLLAIVITFIIIHLSIAHGTLILRIHLLKWVNKYTLAAVNIPRQGAQVHALGMTWLLKQLTANRNWSNLKYYGPIGHVVLYTCSTLHVVSTYSKYAAI